MAQGLPGDWPLAWLHAQGEPRRLEDMLPESQVPDLPVLSEVTAGPGSAVG